MARGGISARGTTALAILSDRQGSFNYQQTLTTHLLPFGDEVYEGNYVFQHDIASIHTSRAIQAFLQDVNVKVIKWPALSPDLNLVENVWGKFVRAVYRGGRQYNSVDKLGVAVLLEWSRLDQD
uniref:Tc1-like transposase DDE domain-containing protein n=1 Tax=Globisporangium ultimum (strain ATCC 200006 / CBS 805.95 / DAOM BR144) TaxID=431595 RepID=K3X8L8_GLOUD